MLLLMTTISEVLSAGFVRDTKMIPLLVFLAIVWQYMSDSPGLTICTIIVGPLVGNMIYNRYFHPLRHFPGPFWASVSDFWKLYFCMTKETHTRGIKLHDRYGRFLLRPNPFDCTMADVLYPPLGPVVRVAPNLLAFNDPKLLPMVYHKNVDKTDFYSTGILGEIAPPFQTLNHKEHAEKKRRIAFAVTMNAQDSSYRCQILTVIVFNFQSEKIPRRARRGHNAI